MTTVLLRPAVLTGHPIAQPTEDASSSLPASTKRAEKKPEAKVLHHEILPLGEPRDDKRFWFQRGKAFDRDAIATQPSVFDDPNTAKDYQPRADWENAHRFKPSARWTWREEDAVVRKIDWRIIPIICALLISLELDKANLHQANSDNFLEDMGMNTNDFNLGNTLFKVAFLVSELPSQWMAKWLGPDVFIPFQVLAWSVVASCQFWLSGKTSFLICRVLLGWFQGGFAPGVVLYLSYWLKHHELTIRLGFIYTAESLADIGSSFLAVGILKMRGVRGLAGWRWLFLIEGLLTLIVGLIAAFLLPPSASQTTGRFRGKKGWFTPREEEILVNRIVREDPGKGMMHNRQPINLKMLWKSLKDYDLWPMYLIVFLTPMPTLAPTQYFTIVMKKNLGWSTTRTNLLTIPKNVLHIIFMLAISYSSEIFQERSWHLTFGHVWEIPFLAWLVCADVHKGNKWTYWAMMTLLLAHPSGQPLVTAWVSRNSGSVRARAVGTAVFGMFLQLSGIVSSNIYQRKDAPNFHTGNRVLLAVSIVNVATYCGTKVYYVWRNRVRDRKWGSMSEKEKVEYLESTKDEGNKRLDFRLAH